MYEGGRRGVPEPRWSKSRRFEGVECTAWQEAEEEVKKRRELGEVSRYRGGYEREGSPATAARGKVVKKGRGELLEDGG